MARHQRRRGHDPAPPRLRAGSESLDRCRVAAVSNKAVAQHPSSDDMKTEKADSDDVEELRYCSVEHKQAHGTRIALARPKESSARTAS